MDEGFLWVTGGATGLLKGVEKMAVVVVGVFD